MDPINPKKYRFNNAKDPENRTYYIKFAHDKNSLLHMEITVKRLLKKLIKLISLLDIILFSLPH